MNLIISGGPGAGCTSTAEVVGQTLDLPVFDSDVFFHKPTDPPFQIQYSPEERRERLNAALTDHSSWIISGSIATWEVSLPRLTHGVFLNVPTEVRIDRLIMREKHRFGTRIETGGDLHDENRKFITWAEGYESREGHGRNLSTDKQFLVSHCRHFLEISEREAISKTCDSIVSFLHP